MGAGAVDGAGTGRAPGRRGLDVTLRVNKRGPYVDQVTWVHPGWGCGARDFRHSQAPYLRVGVARPLRSAPIRRYVPRGSRQYCSDWPPSIGTTVGLMKDASSERRKATRFATSSGRPKRFMGLVLTNWRPASSQFTGSSCLREPSTMGVMMAPGAVASTGMPKRPY